MCNHAIPLKSRDAQKIVSLVFFRLSDLSRVSTIEDKSGREKLIVTITPLLAEAKTGHYSLTIVFTFEAHYLAFTAGFTETHIAQIVLGSTAQVSC